MRSSMTDMKFKIAKERKQDLIKDIRASLDVRKSLKRIPKTQSHEQLQMKENAEKVSVVDIPQAVEVEEYLPEGRF